MKYPKRPPNAQEVVASTLTKDAKRLAVLLAHSSAIDQQGRYLHWDELRFKKSPPGDLTHEEWWATTRLSRHSASQMIGLVDTNGARFSFCDPAPLKEILRDLDMNAGGALGSSETVLSTGEGKRYLARSLAEEPFQSSFIEGAATTRQIAKKLIFEGREPRTKDERMVLNNYRAMQFIKAHKDDDLTIPMLLELHKIVTDSTMDDPADSGRFRTTDDVRVVDDTTNEVLHQPPPVAKLDARLDRLMKFANRKYDSSNWIHPLVRAMILHFLLSYEHPFVDGNGRVARALFYWLALKEGYWLIEYVSISAVIAESKIQYGQAFLHTETDSADLTYFLIYHANILKTSLTRLAEFVERKRKEVRVLERRLGDRERPDSFNHRQSWLLNELARNRLSSITVPDHLKQHGVSYLTARKDLEALVDAGCLEKKRWGKTVVYRPVRNLIKHLTT
ncbi:MAG TPA: Fic family protein [Rhizomicrobium sp.]|nr:Fic family protein [Rhizomicrobium sp.]